MSEDFEIADDLVDIDLSEADPDYDPRLDSMLDDTEWSEPEPERPKLSREALRFVRRRNILNLAQLNDQEPLVWFIEDMLPYVPRTIMVGAGGAFKSFLALDWALCAASHRAWFGRYVKPGKVLYMAGEGARGLPKRIEAWCAHNKVEQDVLAPHIDFMGEPFELGSMPEKTRDVWAEFVRAMRYDYIFIDTLHTATAGADENSNTDMGRVLSTMTHIAGGPLGAACFYVHHKPKDKSGARGAGTLRDDFDVSINVDRYLKTLLTKLSPDKLRDVEDFRELWLKFDKHNPEDRERSSLYVSAIATNRAQLEEDNPDEEDVNIERRETAVDRAKEAIVYHDLPIKGWGEHRMSEELKGLDLGYNFSHATVGRALRELRGATVEVENIQRRTNADDG